MNGRLELSVSGRPASGSYQPEDARCFLREAFHDKVLIKEDRPEDVESRRFLHVVLDIRELLRSLPAARVNRHNLLID